MTDNNTIANAIPAAVIREIPIGPGQNVAVTSNVVYHWSLPLPLWNQAVTDNWHKATNQLMVQCLSQNGIPCGWWIGSVTRKDKNGVPLLGHRMVVLALFAWVNPTGDQLPINGDMSLVPGAQQAAVNKSQPRKDTADGA